MKRYKVLEKLERYITLYPIKMAACEIPFWLEFHEWARPTLHVIDVRRFNDDHSNWLEQSKKDQRAAETGKVLKEIKQCLEHFRCNLNDAIKAINQTLKNDSVDMLGNRDPLFWQQLPITMEATIDRQGSHRWDIYIYLFFP